MTADFYSPSTDTAIIRLMLSPEDAKAIEAWLVKLREQLTSDATPPEGGRLLNEHFWELTHPATPTPLADRMREVIDANNEISRQLRQAVGVPEEILHQRYA